MAADKESKEKAQSTAERLRQKRANKKTPDKPEDNLTLPQRSRGMLDALVFAFMLAMFIRSFVFELFMIPTGSMTPTLIGDREGGVAIQDYDGDGVDDIVYTFRSRGGIANFLQIYLMNEDGTYKDQIFVEGIDEDVALNLRNSTSRRSDMIVVNKFAYWFSTPERADIAVFKVPHRPNPNNESLGIRYEHDKPVYIKRVVGLPGETVSFLPIQIEGRYPVGFEQRYGNKFGGIETHLDARPVYIDNEPLEHPRFETLIHYPRPTRGRIPSPNDPSNTIQVPDDGVLMVGDNSASSSDGRYWGHVPENQLRGKAIFRYMPLNAFGFLK